MNKIFKVLSIASILLMVMGCGDIVAQQEFTSLRDSIAQRDATIEQLKATIEQLKETVDQLAFPADQRLIEINNLVKGGNYEKALAKAKELEHLFPGTREAQSLERVYTKIEIEKNKKRAEEERIAALGFKAIKQESTIEIGYNTITVKGISFASRFYFDRYDGDAWCRAADRNNIWLLATMKIKSEDKNPLLPQLAVYVVEGNQMRKVGVMETRFFSWSGYGSYLGNYHDSGNDFAQISTVMFSLGAEISVDYKKKPLALVVKHSNGLSRLEDRFAEPPVCYKGKVLYPQTLTVADFDGDTYSLIKLINM